MFLNGQKVNETNEAFGFVLRMVWNWKIINNQAVVKVVVFCLLLRKKVNMGVFFLSFLGIGAIWA